MTASTDLARHAEPPPSALDRSQLDEVSGVLHEALADHRAQLAAAVSVSADRADDDDGRAREMAWLAAERAREAIADIEHALDRIEEGTYGSCERCGDQIAFERLAVIPHARHCVSCPGAGGLRL